MQVCLLQNHSGMQDFNVRSMVFDGYPYKYDIKLQFVTTVTRMLIGRPAEAGNLCLI